MMSLIGLIILSMAWLCEFLFMGGFKKIHTSFIVFYALGFLLLIYDAFSSGLLDIAIANFFVLLFSLASIIKLKRNGNKIKRKRKCKYFTLNNLIIIFWLGLFAVIIIINVLFIMWLWKTFSMWIFFTLLAASVLFNTIGLILFYFK